MGRVAASKDDCFENNNVFKQVVHLVNRDFVALTLLYKRMGFIPADQDGKLHAIMYGFSIF